MLAAGLALVYGLLYLAWYTTTPLGRVPVLDGREIFDLARDVAEGGLPHEPFYRAMGWPLLLSFFTHAASSDEDLMFLAGLFGVFCHAISTRCVCEIARWLLGAHPRVREGVFAAGLLYGLHPVAVFFAAEPLDTTFGLSLMMTGVTSLLVRKTRTLFLAGALLMASVFVRPHYLPIFLAAPVLAYFINSGSRRNGFSRAINFLVGAGIVSAAYLNWQMSLAGGWSPLPWQGAYNLYKSNGPDGNTRSLLQKELLDEIHLLDADGRAQNPTRVESLKRFRAETGREDASIAEMNAYWYGQTLAFITYNPWRWGRLLFEKLVYLLNDFEQYNNKTFAWHKARSPLLLWNPISWGVLFVLGVGGLASLPRDSYGRAGVLLMVVAVCAGSALIFLSSDRFRLPLAPFCAVLAAGFVGVVPLRSQCHFGKLAAPVAGMLIAALITFPDWLDARSTASFLQDRLLAARAALVTGNTPEALAYAREASQSEPLRPDVIRLESIALFHTHLSAPLPVAAEEWQRILDRLAQIPNPKAYDRFLAGIALLQTGRYDVGLQLLARVASLEPREKIGRDAAAILWLAGRKDLTTQLLLPDPKNETVLTATALCLKELVRLEDWQIARLLGNQSILSRQREEVGGENP